MRRVGLGRPGRRATVPGPTVRQTGPTCGQSVVRGQLDPVWMVRTTPRRWRQDRRPERAFRPRSHSCDHRQDSRRHRRRVAWRPAPCPASDLPILASARNFARHAGAHAGLMSRPRLQNRGPVLASHDRPKVDRPAHRMGPAPRQARARWSATRVAPGTRSDRLGQRPPRHRWHRNGRRCDAGRVGSAQRRQLQRHQVGHDRARNDPGQVDRRGRATTTRRAGSAAGQGDSSDPVVGARIER